MKGKIRYKGKIYPIEHHDDHIGKWYAKECEAFYELAMLDYIKELTEDIKDLVIVDVGANIGNHSMFFAEECNAEVIAFEPIPENIKLLEKNTSDLNVEIHPIGLGDKKENKGYDINKENMGMSKLIKGTSIEVNKLDAIVKKKVHVLKIDAETYEAKILTGGLKLIKKHRPHIFIEGQTRTHRDAYDKILHPLGYTRLLAFNKTPTYYYRP